MTDRNRRKSNIAFTIMGAALALAIALATGCLYLYRSANPSPAPSGNVLTILTGSDGAVDSDGFPEIDWDYWESVNADIIGWITVPGTEINHPVVQAKSSDPDYYLHHDVYGNYNPLGCLYLDAECEELGLSSKNAVILGHHYGIGGFSAIADYNDKDFAREHTTVLLQTPSSKMRYTVRFADIVQGWLATKRCSFADDTDYETWYEESLATAAMTLDADTLPNQTLSLVTCSYNYWEWNERTVVVASMEQK